MPIRQLLSDALHVLPSSNPLRQLQQFDDRRANIPGEHWATFSAATALFGWAAKSRSPLLRTAAIAGGAVLLVRAVSGRNGFLSWLRRR